ncbi:MAG TPA: calcium-binding protein [Solirubrobacterales bacterium]
MGILLVLLAGAATLYAAGAAERGSPDGPRLADAAGGAMSISDSKGDGAIFDLADIGPGTGGQGEVTIGNTGSSPGALTLAAVERSDSPGLYGGSLSQMLDLRIVELGGGSEAEVYAGGLDAMPELALGTLAAGESRSYRFTVTMRDDGGPESPYVGDNLYQRAATRLRYEWTLTEAEAESEGGGPEPGEPVPTPLSPPPSPSVASSTPPPEVVSPPPESAPAGEILRGGAKAERLVGTSQDDLIYGLGGDDVIFGRGGDDRLFGGAGADRISGGPGADQIYGGAGNDRLSGGTGRDHIYGGSGDDVIFARDGSADVVDCGPGDDTAYVDAHDRTRGCELVHRSSGR